MSGYRAKDSPLLHLPSLGGAYQGGGKNCFNPLQPGFQGEKKGSSLYFQRPLRWECCQPGQCRQNLLHPGGGMGVFALRVSVKETYPLLPQVFSLISHDI